MRVGLAFAILAGCDDTLRVTYDWDDTDLAFLVVAGEIRGPYVGRPRISLAVEPGTSVTLVSWSNAMLEGQARFYDPDRLAGAELVRSECTTGFEGSRSIVPVTSGHRLTLRGDRFVEADADLGGLSLSLPSRAPRAALRPVAEREQLFDDDVDIGATELTDVVRVGPFVAAIARKALYLVTAGQPYERSERTSIRDEDVRSLMLPETRGMTFEGLEVESAASVLMAVRGLDELDARSAIVRVHVTDSGFDALELVALWERQIFSFSRAPDGRVLALTGTSVVLSATTAGGSYVESDIGFVPKRAVYSGDPAQPFLVWGDAGGVAIGDAGAFRQLGPVVHVGDLNGVARVDEGLAAYYAADSSGALYRSTGGAWERLEVALDPAIAPCALLDACGLPSIARWQSLSAARRDGRTQLLALPSACDLLLSVDPVTRLGAALTGSETLMLETGVGLFRARVDGGEAFVFGGEARLLRMDL